MPLSLVAPVFEEPEKFVDVQLYDSSPDCIKILNLDGTVRQLNLGGKLALELDNMDQLNGANWPSLWPGSEQSRVTDAVVAGRAGKRTQFLAFCPTAKNTARWWDVVVTPISSNSTGPQALLVVSRDVTELVHTKEELVRLNEQKDNFLATLSHELRNPLSALLMAASILEKAQGDVSKFTHLSDMIQRQVGHMSRLTEDLLDASRITRGQVSLERTRFDLRNVVDDVGEQLFSMLARKQQPLRKLVPEIPVLITGDQMRLTQVVGNLIANASRYSPKASTIDVAVTQGSKFTTIVVTDQGQGISQEMMGSLFDMYSQGQLNPDGKTSGVGLGLSIVRGMVELHNGTVSVESRGVGMGSTFTVSLPS